MKNKTIACIRYIVIELIVIFVTAIIGMSSYNAMLNVSVDNLFWSIVAYLNSIVCVGFLFVMWFLSYSLSCEFIKSLKRKDTVD